MDKYKRVLLEMMTDRGHSLYDESDGYLIFKSNKTYTFVRFCFEQLDTDSAVEIISFVKNHKKKVFGLVLIVETLPGSLVLEKIKGTLDSFEIFTFRQMSFNVTKHKLVPKHIALTEEQTRELLSKFSVTKDKLPKIKSTDSVVRYYNWAIGTVIKIERSDGDYYRLVY